MKKIRKFKIHVNTGDTVQIISGDYKGQIGTIKKVLTKTHQVIIGNINLKTKHIRPKNENETGEIIEMEAPIDSSNVMLYSTNKKTASRYSKIKITNEKKRKQRILKKTKESL